MFIKLGGFKFVSILVLLLKKRESKNKRKYDTFYSYARAERIINKRDIYDVFESIYTTIITKIQKSLGKTSAWIIDSVIGHNIIISKYIPLAGSRYIKLPNKLDHLTNRLINIQNFDDNERLIFSRARYLNISAHNLKVDK